ALRSRCPGLVIFSPSLVTVKALIPRSTPTACPVPGSGSGSATSTQRDTYQRPSGSRDTVTVDGSMPAASTSGQDQTRASGASSFASHSWPSRHGKPERVYSSDLHADRD